MADSDQRITMSTSILNTFECDILESNQLGVLLIAGWGGQIRRLWNRVDSLVSCHKPGTIL